MRVENEQTACLSLTPDTDGRRPPRRIGPSGLLKKSWQVMATVCQLRSLCARWSASISQTIEQISKSDIVYRILKASGRGPVVCLTGLEQHLMFISLVCGGALASLSTARRKLRRDHRSVGHVAYLDMVRRICQMDKMFIRAIRVLPTELQPVVELLAAYDAGAVRQPGRGHLYANTWTDHEIGLAAALHSLLRIPADLAILQDRLGRQAARVRRQADKIARSCAAGLD